MGEAGKDALRVGFDGSLKLEFHGSNAPTQGVLGGIMDWQRPHTPSPEQEECLLISRSAIDLSERPTAVVGRTPSGKSHLKKYRAKLITPEEDALWKRGASHQGYHYLGCAKTMAQIGKAFAEAMLEMEKK